MKLEPFAFFILLFFSVIGFVVTGIAIHELSHWQDYHNYVYGDSICFLNIPANFTLNNLYESAAGYYLYGYNYQNITIRDKISDIDSYTEKKAYITTAILSIAFTIILVLVLVRRYESKLKEKYLDKVIKENEN